MAESNRNPWQIPFDCKNSYPQNEHQRVGQGQSIKAEHETGPLETDLETITRSQLDNLFGTKTDMNTPSEQTTDMEAWHTDSSRTYRTSAKPIPMSATLIDVNGLCVGTPDEDSGKNQVFIEGRSANENSIEDHKWTQDSTTPKKHTAEHEISEKEVMNTLTRASTPTSMDSVDVDSLSDGFARTMIDTTWLQRLENATAVEYNSGWIETPSRPSPTIYRSPYVPNDEDEPAAKIKDAPEHQPGRAAVPIPSPLTPAVRPSDGSLANDMTDIDLDERSPLLGNPIVTLESSIAKLKVV